MGRSNFSNFDVFAISKELDPILAGSSIANVYELEDLIFELMNFEEAILISCTKSAIVIVVPKPTKICIWSDTLLITINFCFLFSTIPVIYLCSSSRKLS